MRRVIASCLLGVSTTFLAACGGGQPAATEAATPEAAAAEGIAMDAEMQTRMGVKTETASLAKAPVIAEGFARVMDVGPLAAIESEVSAALATAQASSEEHKRLVALAAQDQAASARSVEAARAQAFADQARARLAAQRIGLEWGAALERMSDGERVRMLADITAGRAALIRIDAPSAPGQPARISLQREGGGAPIPVTILGPAATADARLQTPGLLGLVRGKDAALLPSGRMLQAILELGASEEGVILPDGALVRTDGGVFAYVQSDGEHFERRDVSTGRPVSGGWFTKDGLAASDHVVVAGAASLLAAETGPAEAE